MSASRFSLIDEVQDSYSNLVCVCNLELLQNLERDLAPSSFSTDRFKVVPLLQFFVRASVVIVMFIPILYKSITGRYRPVSYRVTDGPITARCRFMLNLLGHLFFGASGRVCFMTKTFSGISTGIFSSDSNKSHVGLMANRHGFPASILYKSTADRYRPVSYPEGPITARYRFM